MSGGKWRAGVVILLAAGGIGHRPPERSAAPRPHDAYVWQRQWTPALETALLQSAGYVRQWRVLGAEMSGRGRLVQIEADRSSIRRTRKPVVVVVRINGQIPSWNHEAAIRESVATVWRWREASIDVAGLEIDHDCATARLGDYARFLEQLRRALPDALTLSITALPAWLESPRLRAVLERADESVLQVHAVVNPRQGLFNGDQALEWARRWNAVSGRPFRVALPTYGSRVSWDAAGGIAAVESEMPRFANLVEGTELVVRPLDVAGMMNRLERSRLARFAGFAWFRVPTSGDRRAWTLPTWFAVMRGEPLAPEIRAHLVPSGTSGTVDVYVRNTGPVDETLPPKIDVVGASRCEGADGLGPYTSERVGHAVRFRLAAPLLLRAGQARLIGWVRCGSPGGQMHAEM